MILEDITNIQEIETILGKHKCRSLSLSSWIDVKIWEENGRLDD